LDPQEYKIPDICIRSRALLTMEPVQRRYLGLFAMGYSHKQIGDGHGLSKSRISNVISNCGYRIKLFNLPDPTNMWGVPSKLGILNPFISDEVFCAWVPGLPPSVNSAYPNRTGAGKGRYISAEGKMWKGVAGASIESCGKLFAQCEVPIVGRTGVSVFLHVPKKLKDKELVIPNWDTNNRLKIVLDVLTEMQVWPDDRWNDDCSITRVYDDGIDEPLTEIIVWKSFDVERFNERIFP